MTDVHQAFREAHAFVTSYFQDLGRLLRFAREQFERHEFTLLRHNGERHYSEVDSLFQRPELWIASWLFTFYAPMTARRKYGAVTSTDAPHVAFVGAALGTDAEVPDTPAIWLGWIEGYQFKDHLEKREALDTFYNAIDPPRLDPVPEPLTSLERITLTRSKKPETSLELTMARVPMHLVTSERDIEKIVEHVVTRFPRLKP